MFSDFSQRRFTGFRHEVEFDMKLILVGSKRGFEVLSYRKDKVNLRSICVYELPSQNEEILHVSFADQEKPMFIVMVTAMLHQKNETSQLRCRLLGLRQPSDQSLFGQIGLVEFDTRNSNLSEQVFD